jgi:hypothetical protein
VVGPFSDGALIRQVATELQASHRSRAGQFLLRVVIFAHKAQPKLSVRQVTFNDIADFLERVRAPCWRDRGHGARSPHSQWHPFIKDLWKIADPDQLGDPQVKIQAILQRLANAAEERAGANSANV